MGYSIMTKWEELDLEPKIIKVLSMAKRNNKHVSERSYLTSYQIAIELDKKYSNICNTLGMKVGGRGIGRHRSLTQYIAGELSERISNQEIHNVERAFISTSDIKDIEFSDTPSQKNIHSSKGNNNTISMFRIK